MKKTFAILLALSTACVSAEVKNTVKVWEGTIDLPTYQEGTPDRNPPFDEYATDRFNYPYTLRTELTGVKKPTRWRAVFLENEYLRCSVLPDIGGHLYTCTDKLNGRSMFYDNSTIKKAKIGYRGAWAAFGIEFNFPLSHNWVSMSPVDYSLHHNPDGSASVTVGNTDRVYGMRWVVELILRPGQSVLEEDVRLANLSDVRHRYYWWNNAAVRVWDDSRIDYPMHYTASHGFTEISPWPMMSAEGKDLRIIANQTDGPVSRFVYGSREPYMGVWNPRTDSGTAHYAEYAELPGKKIWSWGSDQEGHAWRKALSDDDSAYVEVQGGLYRNQETYAFLQPAQTLHFHEYWMPVRGTGGITRANRNGVLYMRRDGDQLHVALNVNHAAPNSHLTLESQGAVLWQGAIDLAPEATWQKDIKRASPAPVHFVWKSASGEVDLDHTEDHFDWDKPQDVKLGPQEQWTVPAKDRRTIDDWLREGTRLELLGRSLVALEAYQEAEKRFPGALSLKLASARVLVGLSRFDEALPGLEACAANDTADASIAYLLGLAREGSSDLRGALPAYETAFRQDGLRAAAALKLGELHARLGDGKELTFLQAAAAASPDDQNIAEELAIAANLKPADAVRLLTRFPLSHGLRELAGNPDLPRLAADPYLTLQTAGPFIRLAHWQQAFAILTREYPAVPELQKEPGYVLPQHNPLVLYAAALSAEHLGQPPDPYLKRAQASVTTWVFPSTREDELSLRFALSRNPENAQAHALFGMLLFSRGQASMGMNEWKKALSLDPSLPVVGAQLGKAQLLQSNDPSEAVKTLKAAIQHDPRNPAIYETLDQAASLLHEPAAARARELGSYPTDAAMPAPLLYQLALTLAEAGEYDRADQLFQGRFFPREEGGVSAGQVQFEIALLRAAHLAQTGQCSTAPSASNQDGILNDAHGQTLWRLAAIAESCGRHDHAVALWTEVSKLTSPADLAWAHRAAKQLPGYNESQWHERLTSGLAAAQKTWEVTAYRGWWQFQIALLYGALGEMQQKEQALQETFKLPDSLMSHHLARQESLEK